MSVIGDGEVTARFDFMRHLLPLTEDSRFLDEQRYTNMRTMSLDDLLGIPPPPALYTTPVTEQKNDSAAAVTDDSAIYLEPTTTDVEPDVKRHATFEAQGLAVDIDYRRTMVARYANSIFTKLLVVWDASTDPVTGSVARDARWPGRHRMRDASDRIAQYCTQNCTWLNQYTANKRTRGASALFSLQTLRERLLCVEHQLMGTDSESNRRFRDTVGAVRFSDSPSACALQLVATARPLREQSADDVYRFVTRMTARLQYMVPRLASENTATAAAVDDITELLRCLDVVELWMARIHIVTRSASDVVIAGCPLRRQQQWFTKVKPPASAAAVAENVVCYALASEYVADMTLMIYELRRMLLVHRNLCCPPQTTLLLNALTTTDDIVREAALPRPFSDAVLESVVRLVYGKRSDPRTFLEQVHTTMLRMSVRIGESERYQRGHNNTAARRPSDLMHYVRGHIETAYLVNKSSEPSLECMWDEEVSPLMRELFVHELLSTDFSSRTADYDWKRENVLYAPAITESGQQAAEQFIEHCATNRVQPFIVQSLGCFLLLHRRQCYRTTKPGEAAAMWFWLADVRRLPPAVQRLTEAYRQMFWNSNAVPLQTVDDAPLTSLPPSNGFVMVTD